MNGQPMMNFKYEENAYMKQRAYDYLLNLVPNDDQIKCINELGAARSIVDHVWDELAGELQDYIYPQIVVVGGESNGKTTMMERIAMMPLFLKGQARVTRMKIIYKLRKGPDANPVITMYHSGPDGDVAERTAAVTMEQGALGLQAQMVELTKLHPNHTGIFQDRFMVVEITNRSAPDLDLVDLPGIVSAPAEEEAVTKQLIYDHDDKHGKNSIYLFVMDAAKDIDQTPIALIKDRPMMEKKTIGVITQMDKLDPADKERLESLRQLAAGGTPEHIGAVPLANGYFLTLNAPVGEHAGFGYEAIYLSAQLEHARFEQMGLGDVVEQGRAGCAALVSKLHSFYWAHLQKEWLPKVFDKINSRWQHWKDTHDNLGLPAAHDPLRGAQRTELVDAIKVRFASLLSDYGSHIKQAYEDECMTTLMSQLQTNLTPFTLSRSETHERLLELVPIVLQSCAERIATDHDFLLNKLKEILRNDASPLKFGRFDCLIGALQQQLQNKLQVTSEGIMSKLETLLHSQVSELQGLRFVTNRDTHTVTVTPHPELAEAILHLMSTNLHRFFITLNDERFMLDTLNGTSLIENCAEERFEALNNMKLLSIAKTKLQEQGGTLQAGNTDVNSADVEDSKASSG
jgi:hypothetical protein